MIHKDSFDSCSRILIAKSFYHFFFNGSYVHAVNRVTLLGSPNFQTREPILKLGTGPGSAASPLSDASVCVEIDFFF